MVWSGGNMRTGENIYKRKDGRWEARYKCGYTNSGKPKYKAYMPKLIR